MLYCNNQLGPLRHVFPDLYMAVSINEFIEESNLIKKPSWKKLLFGFSPLAFGSNVGITFNNVTLKFLHHRQYKISDITGEIIVAPAEELYNQWQCPCSSALRKNLTEKEYFELAIQFNPLTKHARLWYTDELGPPSDETTSDLDRKLDGRLLPCLS